MGKDDWSVYFEVSHYIKGDGFTCGRELDRSHYCGSLSKEQAEQVFDAVEVFLCEEIERALRPPGAEMTHQATDTASAALTLREWMESTAMALRRLEHENAQAARLPAQGEISRRYDAVSAAFKMAADDIERALASTASSAAALRKRKSPPNLMGLYAATVAIVRRRGPGFTALDAEVEIGKAFDKSTAQWLASLPAPAAPEKPNPKDCGATDYPVWGDGSHDTVTCARPAGHEGPHTGLIGAHRWTW